MRIALVAATAGLLFIPSSASAGKQESARIAVLAFQAKLGFAPEKAEMFTEFIEGAIRERGFEVIGKSDIDAILGFEQMKDVVGCDDASCMAEIGGALGVDEIIHGSIGRMGRYLLITAKRTSMHEVRVLKQSTKKLKGGGDEALLDAIAPVVTKLFGPAAAEKPASLARSRATADSAPAAQSRPPKAKPAPATPPRPAAGDVDEGDTGTKTATTKSEQEQELEDMMRGRRSSTSNAPADPEHSVTAAPEPDEGPGLAQLPLLPTALLGAGAFGFATAGFFQFRAWGHHKNATDEDYRGRQVETESGRSNQTYARLAAAGGALLAATGAVLWWLAPSADDEVQVSGVPSRDGTLVLVTGGF